MKFGNGNFLTRLLFLVGACWLLLAALVPRSASAAASLTVDKSADVECAMVGDTIYYTIEIENEGTVNLTNVIVNDSLFGNVTKKIFGTTKGTLYVGNEVSYTFSYKVKATDPDPLLNTVTVTAKAVGVRKDAHREIDSQRRYHPSGYRSHQNRRPRICHLRRYYFLHNHGEKYR